MQTLIEPTIDTKNSDGFTPAYNIITLVCNGLQGDETVTLQVQDLNGDYFDYKIKDVVQQFTSGTNVLDIYMSAGVYRVVKSATANPVGVGISKFISTNGV